MYKAGVKNKDLAEKYGIPRNTVSTILKNANNIINAVENKAGCSKTKRLKKGMYENVEKAVFDWFKLARERNLPISGAIIKQKALECANSLREKNFKASTRWLENWKQRCGISPKKLRLESEAVPTESGENWHRNDILKLLEKYEERDVFSADETGLFYKYLPDKSLTFKNETFTGGKNTKDHVTCLFATNMDGSEKQKILMIGKSSKPRCFDNVKWLPLDYESNQKAWMTARIFENWLLKWDKRLFSEGRKILLLINNCTAHPYNVTEKLKSIELQFFPSNITSHLQPLNQGIIVNLKCNYRRRILTNLLNEFEKTGRVPKLSLIDCVEEINKAWTLDLKSETIVNCFKKAGICKYSDRAKEDDKLLISLNKLIPQTNIDEDARKLESKFEAWVELTNSHEIGDFIDYINVDESFCTPDFETEDDFILKKCEPEDNDNEEESSDDEEAFEPSSNEAVAEALRLLRRFLYTNEDTTDEFYGTLNNIEKLFEKKDDHETKPNEQMFSHQ